MTSSYYISPEELRLTDEQLNTPITSEVGPDYAAENAAEEKKRKKKEPQAIAEQKQRTEQLAASKKNSNPVAKVAQELGTAVVGAGIDAVEGIGATAERALTLNSDPNFVPTWFQVDDKVEPLNKTWWGNLIRGVGEYALLSVATRKGANKIGGPVGKVLGGNKLGNEIARGAVVGNLSSQAEEDNLSNLLSEKLGFVMPTAINDKDGPVVARLKSTLEGIGFDFGFGKIAGAFAGAAAKRRAAQALDNEELRKQIISENGFGTKYQREAKAIEDLKAQRQQLTDQATLAKAELDLDPSNPDLIASYQAAEAAAKEVRDKLRVQQAQFRENQRNPDAVAETVAKEEEAKYAKAADKVDEENAIDAYERDPNFENGPNPRTHAPELFDQQERARLIPVDNLRTVLDNNIKIDVDPVQRNGRIGTLMTEANLKKLIEGRPEVTQKILKDVMKQMARDPQLETFIGGVRVTRQEAINRAAFKILDYLEVFDDLDPEEFRAYLLKNDGASETLDGKKFEFPSRVGNAAVQVLLRSLAGDAASLADVERSLRGQVATDTQTEMVLDRLQMLLRLNKEHSYMMGSGLQSRSRNWGKVFNDSASVDQAILDIRRDVDTTIGSLKDLADGGDNTLLKLFLDATSLSGGNVKTLTDMHNFYKKKIGMHGWLSAPAGEQGYLLKAFIGQFFNSVLSAPKTIVKAWVGTNMMAAMRPLTLLVGATIRGDRRLIAKSLAQMNFGKEAFLESLEMAGKSMDSWIKGDGIDGMPLSMADQTDLAFHKTEAFQAAKAYAEIYGSDGDKWAAAWAERISQFNDWPFAKYTMGMMSMGDVFTRTMLARMELKSRAFDEAWIESNGKVTSELVDKYIKKFRNSIFDADGTITDPVAQMLGDESTLTTPLMGRAEDIEQLIRSVPLLRPFFLFPRTSINALTLTSSYTPLLNRWLPKFQEITGANMDNALEVMQKYGISDLEAEQAMMHGRSALGVMITAAAGFMFIEGRITGNQNVSAEQRRIANSISKTPPPRSIKIGDTWISYDAFEPFASVMSLTADIFDKVQPEDQENAFAKVGHLIAMNVTNRSFLSGLQTFSELASGKLDAAGPTYVANFFNNFLPYGGARNWIANAWHPGKRELENDIATRFMNRNPVLRGMLPAIPDMLTGEPLDNAGPWARWINASFPFNVTGPRSQTAQLLMDSGFDTAVAFETGPNKERLDNVQKQQLKVYASEGGFIGKRLEELFKSQKYFDAYKNYRLAVDSGLPKEQWPTTHQEMIGQIVREAKERAMTRMRIESGSGMTQNDIFQASQSAGRGGDVETQRQQIQRLIDMN